MAKNFELHECVIFVHFTKIGTHENKGIHSTLRRIYDVQRNNELV